jgi:hypothetical protein
MNHKTKMLIPIVGISLLIGYVALMSDWIDKSRKSSGTSVRSSAPSAGAAVMTAESFDGGTFEASGITHVAGTDGFLFVDDGRPGEVLWMVLDKSGKQAGSITPVKLGVDVDDPEGITTDGTYLMGIRSIEYDVREGFFYIIGGATEGQDKTDFKLWEWTGRADGSGLREMTTFDRKLQPEGVSSGGADSHFKLIVFDTSRYLTIP